MNPWGRWRHRAQCRVADALMTHAERLISERGLESDVLLDVANHYVNEIVGVRSDPEGRLAVQALARGYALRVVEEQDGLAAPPASDAVAQMGALLRAGRTPSAAVAAVAAAAAGPPPRFAAGAHGWALAVERARVATRREAPAGVAVDAGGALRFGYEARRAEAALAAADAGLFDLLPAVALDALLADADAAIASGDAMFAQSGTRVALVIGALHGLDLEHGAEPAREMAVAAARAGYALRRAEERRASVPPGSPTLRSWLARAQGARADVPMWDVLQILGWEVADRPGLASGTGPPEHDDAPGMADLAGHPERDCAFIELADAVKTDVGGLIGVLAPGDVVRAVRFGYALRAAECSLPDGASGS